MIKPEEITLDTLSDIVLVLVQSARAVQALDDDCNDGIKNPMDAVKELKPILQRIQKAFAE